MIALFKLGLCHGFKLHTPCLLQIAVPSHETNMRRSGSWSCVRETADVHRQTMEPSTFDSERSPDGAVYAGVYAGCYRRTHLKAILK
jgi:hypothetical protein